MPQLHELIQFLQLHQVKKLKDGMLKGKGRKERVIHHYYVRRFVQNADILSMTSVPIYNVNVHESYQSETNLIEVHTAHLKYYFFNHNPHRAAPPLPPKSKKEEEKKKR